MKTTVELSDALFRRAKAEAALRGRKLKELIAEGLQLVLESPAHAQRKTRPSLHDLMQESCGIIDSGVPDLGSNPKHLKGFGRVPRRHR